MAKITFATNVPVELRLQSLDGEVAPSQFGGNQIKFTAHEGPFWVSEAVGSILADQIRKKHIQPHVPVEVARREIAQSNGRKGIQWTIDPLGFVPGEQPDGTFAVSANGNGANGSHPPAPSAAAPQKSTQPLVHFDNNTNGNANGHTAPHATILAHSGWAASLRDQTQALIDVYADCLRYSARHEGLVKSEDVRSAVTVRLHQRLEDEWQRQRRPAMTSPETLAVEKFLHRFSRRSLDPIPTDGLLAAKQRIDTVIDERTRQFPLFDAPPELELVPAPSPITQHPSPAPMSQIADVLSPSQVRTFMDCSARWWYKYGLGLPDPKGSSLVRGIVVHRMAEIYLRTKFAGAAPEVDELAEIFENVWNETSAEGSFQPGEDLDKLKAQTATLARMYLDEVAPEIEPAVIRGEPAIEMAVSGEISGVKVRGILDLVDSRGCIRDLKTAARKPSAIAPDYALQIATYAEIAPEVTGEAQTGDSRGHQDAAARHHGLSRE